MDDLLLSFEDLKISAFSKVQQLKGNIHNVTIGPNQTLNSTQKTEVDHAPAPPRNQEANRKSSPKIETISFRQIRKDLETQRQEKVQEALSERYKQFNHLNKVRNQNQWLAKQQAFIQKVQQQEQDILDAMERFDASKATVNKEATKQYIEMMQRRKQMEMEMEKAREKQRILNSNISKIKSVQEEFNSLYQELSEIMKAHNSDEDFKKILSSNERFNELKTLPGNIEKIVAKCKTLNVSEADVKYAEDTLNILKNLIGLLESDIKKINDRRDELRKQELDRVKARQKTEASAARISLSLNAELDAGISPTNLKKYLELRQFLLQHTQSFQQLVTDESQKQFRFDCKKAINIPVNALSAVSAEHLADKYVKLSGLLSGKPVPIGDKMVNASRHPQGIAFCMDLLAKKFVLQGDLMISSNPEAAYSYATIIVTLWCEFPAFGQLLLSYFYTECPYLVPYYIPKSEGQTDEDYYTSLGYQYINGQIEKQDKFLKRMTGIFRLYFAILIAKPKKTYAQSPFSIKNAWMFLASILKLDPQLDITATAIHTCLETIGFELERVYGKSFRKLLQFIISKFMVVLKKIDSGGPVTRLEVLLQDYKQKRQFEKPSGVLPATFW